jgi:hypothetical protein
MDERKRPLVSPVQGFDARLFEPEPSYLVFSSAAFLLGVAYERAVNGSDKLAGLRANIFGKLVK